jgi:hypothetical protein
MTFSLRQQIEEVEREIALRKRVYPKWITRGKLRRSEADYFMGRMEAVLETLQKLHTPPEDVL